ncbi:DUF6932 family protein [Spirosoma utsteinense]|uniref:Polymerase nucleotidyl transferase domain-containing protein n=1 Tax=Spirosoma utsteinense TaxID=2585773 RepID=A0ABR6W596_9BACT|nr:hypothetical protein [Spirosoma utsteinense]MBC3785610.1 hypothetical protein [Spirosoma utsteinense]MBC3791761.1 hypothetical protein [Spirosoma utsteinense]
MIELNQKGLIVPDYNVPSTVPELATVFVKDRATPQRLALFRGYLDYMTDLCACLGELSFTQWVDGSFTTAEPHPGDIDIVTFLSFADIDKLGPALKPFTYPQSLGYGMDAYLVRVFPPEHRLFALYVGDRDYWLDKFTKTERNRRGIVYKKGFLELIYSDEERTTLKSLRSDS